MILKSVWHKWLSGSLILLFLTACVSEGTGINITKFKERSSSERKEEAVRIKTQLAIEYMNARDYRSAVATIEEAIKTDSRYDMAWLVRAQIYQFLKTYDKAEESFKRALSISPNGAEINNNYGWYLCSVQHQAAQSITYFDRALADPTYPSPEIAYMNKGICSAKAGQVQMADSYFERALGLNPDAVAVYKERARVQFQMGKLTEADKLFRIYQSRVPALSPDDLLLGWKMARAQGNNQAAYEYEAQLRTNFPYSEETLSINTGNTE
ncbi:MAG: type IV pilus biogenesis/stability protein PilW [Alysiella sp.]|uniref:type IV pilus biogenesis/stability protein PilW n=1 Tax=Alysiella sp. TaxID=1872483 RepID=UPI0026DAD2CE|nr:type IV pilus biogenesis/stability protein PilW [Alysiella sp.]MDO4434241.1 type IV pilus biogenesis/stability protein PilW [Alysiella sp.]